MIYKSERGVGWGGVVFGLLIEWRTTQRKARPYICVPDACAITRFLFGTAYISTTKDTCPIRLLAYISEKPVIL